MEKKQYESPEMQIILINAEDIITSSSGSGIDEGDGSIPG